MFSELYKYRVEWRDLKGKRHRETVKASTGYIAAQLIRLKYDDVDLIIRVYLLRYQKED